MTETAPFFSVVIPVYNKGPHVARAIKSVLTQTFQDFEMVLINDASTDNSLDEMNRFSDPRIRVLHRDTPGPGGYAARNLGIRDAKAEWVAFLDADDEWYPEHLGKMKELIERFPNVKFFSSGWESREEGTVFFGRYLKECAYCEPHVISCKQYLECLARVYSPAWMGVAVVSRKIPFVGQLFPEEKGIKRKGDLRAWLKLICFLKEMAWGPHIGAIYHRDSVNRVSKSAPANLNLFDNDALEELGEDLDTTERKLLRKVFNRLKVVLWKEGVLLKQEPLILRKYLFWHGDVVFCSKWTVISLIPDSIIRRIIYAKKS